MGTFAAKALLGVGAIVLAVAAFRLLMGLLGAVFGIISFVLFTVVPLLIVGWIVVKIWKSLTRKPAYDN